MTAEAPAIELKGGAATLLSLQLRAADLPRIEQELQRHIARAPALFEQAPLALDLTALGADQAQLDVAALVDLLRRLELCPVGVQGATQETVLQARKVHLAVLPAAGAGRPAPVASPEDPPEATAPAPTSLTIHRPVRSGQRVVVPDADIVVVAPVNRGAEIVAGGHIHVYGALRGRALAGASGCEAARIFCLEFNPDLVAIAGVYLVNDELDPELIGKPITVWLDADRLRFAPLGGRAAGS